MRVLKIVGGILISLILLVVILFMAARFHDGPLGMAPGGPLASGEIVVEPVQDWAFATEVDTIEFQLSADDTSRTTWILVDEGRAFIPCSMSFPPWKDWYLRADRDGRATIRVLGKRYAVELDRVEDETLASKLKSIVRVKYDGGPPSDGETWFFALNPRGN